MPIPARFSRADAEAELRYCMRLARDGRTAQVPGDAVAPYLDVQAAGARRDGRQLDARAYESAAHYWREGARALALETLSVRLIRLTMHGEE